MPNDLTTSPVDRQNILNNPYAVAEIEKAVGMRGILFEGRSVVLKEQVAAFFAVTVRTIENYLDRHGPELSQNGYEVLRGKRLQDFKLAIQGLDVTEADFGNILKTPQLGVFDIRAFLNLSMLLVESERARVLRQAILDIVIDTINQRTGGGTKYINQRDEDFLQSAFVEENYRKQFTSALSRYVDMGNFKYAVYTDKIYVSIFREKAQEYRKILKLEKRDQLRETMYAEVLDLVASFETGIADAITKEAATQGRKLSPIEVDQIFARFVDQAHWRPLLDKARMKMASRDLAFRDALHLQLKDYVTPVKREDYERFIGERSKELSERLEEAKDIMKRLKDRG
jgi:hypothetical protein